MKPLSVQMKAYWLLIITPLVLLVLFGGSIYSSRQMRRLEQDAVSVATNGGPSIRYLTLCQDVVRRTEIAIGRAIGSVAQGRPPDTRFLDENDRQMRVLLDAYVALPFYPGERALYNRATDDLHDFTMAAQDVLDLLQTKRLDQAREATRTRLRPRAERAIESLSSLIDLNAKEIGRSAAQVVQLRPRIERVKFLIQGLAALMTVFLVFLTWLSFRARERLFEDRRRFAEERAQELELFAGRVAHDLRNPLAAISARLQVARLSGEQSYANVDRQVQSMSKLIEGLLDFAVSGAHPGPGASCALDALEREVLPSLRDEARRADVELSASPLPSLTVACTQGALTSIISNLVHNAIKFTVGRPLRRVTLRAAQQHERILIEVEDTGPGIPAGQERQLFQPFVRLHTAAGASGLGLGLATVRRLVEGYGGKVGVRSRVDMGSTFWVELPIATSPPPKSPILRR